MLKTLFTAGLVTAAMFATSGKPVAADTYHKETHLDFLAGCANDTSVERTKCGTSAGFNIALFHTTSIRFRLENDTTPFTPCVPSRVILSVDGRKYKPSKTLGYVPNGGEFTGEIETDPIRIYTFGQTAGISYDIVVDDVDDDCLLPGKRLNAWGGRIILTDGATFLN